MTGDQSLLSFLDAPVVVGDPEGRAVYVNPAFEAAFERTALGVPLAELFEGGAREAVLRAVVSACDKGESVRFRMRERDVGYSAVVSPIVAAEEQVGVVILFKEEIEGAERLLALHREIAGPLEEISSTLDALFEQTGGRRNPHHRLLVEDGIRAVGRLRKWVDEMSSITSGRQNATSSGDRVDVLAAVQEAARRARRTAQLRGVALDMLLPSTIPDLRGDEGLLVSTLAKLADARVNAEPAPDRMVWSVRVTLGRSKAVILSLTEQRGGGYEEPFHDAPVIKEAVASLGAELHCTALPSLGRTTVLHFGLR